MNPESSMPSASEPAVLLRAVNKSFRNGEQVTPVLKQVEFAARAGEMLFVTGPSGCGKTTLLSVLCGTLNADSGEVHTLGQALHRLSAAQVTRFRAQHIGFIFQQFNLIPSLTAAENVAVPLRIQGVSAGKALPRAKDLLARVGLPEKINERPSRLSGGQQQRVAIARALVHEPALIVCDEPTSALDSATGQQVLELLRSTTGQTNRTVIVVTHDPRVYRHANRMAEMEDGRIQRVLESPQAIAAAHSHH
jgi:putative ABC transport system ATP-binding protein